MNEENKGSEVKWKKIASIITLLIVALVSVFVISKMASSTKFHAKTMQELDDKKITVMELTVATAGASTALALVPGDTTTPLANQILNLSSYLLIIIGAIFFEKILLTLTGYITFTFLIPVACFLGVIYIFTSREILRNIAIKLAIFGIVIFITVPISVKVSGLIENTYKDSINQTMEAAKNTENEIKQDTSDEDTKEESWVERISFKSTRNSI